MVVGAKTVPWRHPMKGENDASLTNNTSSRRFPLFMIASRTTRKYALRVCVFLYLFLLVAETNAAPFLSTISQTARWNDNQSRSIFPSAVNGKGSTPPILGLARCRTPRTPTTVSNTAAVVHASAVSRIVVLCCSTLLRGGGDSSGSSAGRLFFIPAGWNPLGYKITVLGEEFLKFDGSLDCDLGRFLASLKAGRRRTKALKASWLEIVRVSKTGQSMRIYRKLDDLILFSLRSGLIN